MAAELPSRPRLADHVLARRHLRDGREFVLLHDEARRETIELEPVTWAVLSCADGTRDIEGIAAAASRIGAPSSAEAVRALLGALHAQEALVEGAPAHAPDTVTLRRRPPQVESLPVAPLPGYRFDCDGSGGCCKAYGSILLTPSDRDRAKVALEGRALHGIPASRWFTPDRGSAPTPLGVPLSVEGGCGFLGEDGGCEIHRRIGLEGKPRACAAFPVVACADGVEVRVSVVPECACVLRSSTERGDPLAQGWTRGADLPGTTVIDQLSPEIRVTSERSASRAWLRDELLGLLGSLTEAPDPARVCWQRADAWAGTSSEPELGERVETLRHDAKDLMRRRALHCRPDDWVLRSLQWLVATLHVLTDRELQALVLQPMTRPEEVLFVQAGLWVYRGFDDASAVDALRRYAWRIWIARAMAEVPLAPSETAVPLATLEMLLRGHGLSRAV